MDLKRLHSRIIDKADSRNVFFHKNGGNARQMAENLMKIVFIDDGQNLHHWSKEFANAYQDILNTYVSNDNKSNEKRGRYLKQLLITGPCGDDLESFLHYFLGAADNALEDEDVNYDYETVKTSLTLLYSDITNLYLWLIESQNVFFPELRGKIYEKLEILSDVQKNKFRR